MDWRQTSRMPSGVVLIVEDDDCMRQLLSSMLREFGFRQIVEANSVALALKRLTLHAIDLVVLDLGLGAEDGGELIAAIRAHALARVRAVPLVVASTSSTAARVLETQRAGADGFVSKPLSTSTMRRQVSLAFSKRRAENSMPSAATASASPTETRHVLEIE